MPRDDDRPKPPGPALDDTQASGGQTARPSVQPALDQTLAAGSNDGSSTPVGAGGVIRPPKPSLTETLADSSPSIALPEERVDRYLLKQRLGAGGMGVVFQATDTELGRDVAIKMIKSGASADRLKREAQALARLDHPNVVTVYDVGEHEGRVFVAMELVDGSNLTKWCSTSDHTTDEILRVLLEAAKGIIAAHDAGMIHRDLKPDNIFVANDGRVLVGDFGLARDSDDDDGKGFDTMTAAHSLTQTGHVLGTPAYMAPEQAEGEATDKSDQFSFCVTAYEALYGTRPFIGATFEEILDHVDSGEIEAPKRRRKVPTAVVRAIRRGLHALPERRFGSMKELVAALRVRKLRLWPYLAGAAALAAAVTVTIAVTRPDAPAACGGGNVATVWNPTRRAALVASLQRRGFTAPAADDIGKRLDDYTVRWSRQQEETCAADRAHKLPARAATARGVCQSLALAGFEESVRSIETDQGINVMATAMRTNALPAVEICASDDAMKLAVSGREHETLIRDLSRVGAIGELQEFIPLRQRAIATNDLPAQLEIALVEVRRAIDARAWAVAEAALQRGMPLAEQLDATSARVRLLAISAQIRCEQHKDPESYLTMAEAASKRLDPTRSTLEVIAVIEARSYCLMNLPDPSPAIPVFEQLIELVAARTTDDLRLMPYRGNLSIVYRRLGRVADAEKYEALINQTIVKYAGDSSALANAAANDASTAFFASDVRTAIDHQLRAVQLFTVPLLKAQSLGMLAGYYDVLLEWRAAVNAQVELIKIVETLPVSSFNEQLLAEAHAFGGWDLLYLDDVDGAFGHLETALPLATKHDESELVAVSQLGLGRVALARRDHVRAVRFLQDGLATHTKLGDAAKFRVAIGLYALAQAQWELGDTHSARESIKQAELAGIKGLEQARALPLGKHGLPYKQKKLDEITAWRAAHP